MFTGFNNSGRGSVSQIPTVFGPFCHVFCGRDLLNGILQTFIESPFSETVIWEIHRLEDHLFFQNVQNLMQILKIQRKLRKSLLFLR